jgi:hypothetical protein
MMKTNSNSFNPSHGISTLEDGTIVIKVHPQKIPIHSENPEAPPPENSDKISQKQAADWAGVTVQTIINWETEGKIKGYGISRRPVWYSLSELKAASQKRKKVRKPK